ncbi:hypothetical protein EIP91_006661 [Steccherinum ochraceum]|uniref:BTB domain-containing protein n=1 Tax=Steccherinum ochraceum TaxID=92696 RepID=A0A4V2MVI1_9APHY|nr:hypothetical protein EIP91_006661 [Steccherinum ochraceum]
MATDARMSPPAHTYAASPFDRTDRDIILLSADQVNFACHKTTLSIASPFFADMFTLPQAPRASVQATNDGPAEIDGTPVIPVTESGRTLDTLLRLIYPVDAPAMDDPAHIVEVLCAGRKYQISQASIGMMTLFRTIRKFIASHPMRSFAIFCLHALEEEALEAAKQILRKASSKSNVLAATSATLMDTHIQTFLREGHAGAFFRLREYLRNDGQVEDYFRFTYDNRPPQAIEDNSEPWHSYFFTGLGSEHDPIGLLHVPADLHIRSSYSSSDHLVHKLILYASSPILGKLADTCLEVHEDGLPVLQVAENEEVLRHLLLYSYGSMTSMIHQETCRVDALLFLDVFRAANKYFMSNLVAAMRVILRPYITTDPIQAYYVAAACGWESEVREAARNTLAIEGRADESYVTTMEHAPAQAHAAFVQYYIMCNTAVGNIIKGHCSSANSPELPSGSWRRNCPEGVLARSGGSVGPAVFRKVSEANVEKELDHWQVSVAPSFMESVPRGPSTAGWGSPAATRRKPDATQLANEIAKCIGTLKTDTGTLDGEIRDKLAEASLMFSCLLNTT